MANLRQRVVAFVRWLADVAECRECDRIYADRLVREGWCWECWQGWHHAEHGECDDHSWHGLGSFHSYPRGGKA